MNAKAIIPSHCLFATQGNFYFYIVVDQRLQIIWIWRRIGVARTNLFKPLKKISSSFFISTQVIILTIIIRGVCVPSNSLLSAFLRHNRFCCLFYFWNKIAQTHKKICAFNQFFPWLFYKATHEQKWKKKLGHEPVEIYAKSAF